jgi:tRNA pseudouridine38-40 synthase
MTRWRLTIEYDGGPFMGWQRQDHGPSVQQSLEEAIGRITGEPIRLHCAGRTDAGVHALAMTAHCDIAKPLTEHRLREGANALVRPAPIAVTAAEPVADDWHARFSCRGRRSIHCQSDSPVKTLDSLTVERVGEEVQVRAAARSFLHHQVRSMVGCLALAGLGRWSADDIRAALEARDRHALGLNAPPQGLYFVAAIYD